MYMAELKGHLPGDLQRSEDILTSYFFGTMKNIPFEEFLLPWLSVSGIELCKTDAQASFSFWEALEDNTEPDLIIRTGGKLILVEVKYLSKLGADPTQLEREIAGGLLLAKKEGKAFTFIALTNDFIEPVEIAEIKNRFPPEDLCYLCLWTSWEKSFRLIEELAARHSPYKGWLKDLLGVMAKRGLRGFRGFGYMKEKIMKCNEALGVLDEISTEVSSFFLELDPLLKENGFDTFEVLKNTVIRDGAFRQLNQPRSWMTTYFARAYRKTLGDTEPEDAIYFIKIRLDEPEPQMETGVALFYNREDKRPFDHREANGFFLAMKEKGLEPCDELSGEILEGIDAYRILDRLALLETRPLVSAADMRAMGDVAVSFLKMRKIAALVHQSLKKLNT